jgi:hypothetical protein
MYQAEKDDPRPKEEISTVPFHAAAPQAFFANPLGGKLEEKRPPEVKAAKV